MDYDTGKALEAINAKLDYLVSWIQSVESEAKENVEKKKAEPVAKRPMKPEPEPEPEELPEQPEEEYAEEPEYEIKPKSLEEKAKEYAEKTPPPDMQKVDKKIKSKYPFWRKT